VTNPNVSHHLHVNSVHCAISRSIVPCSSCTIFTTTCSKRKSQAIPNNSNKQKICFLIWTAKAIFTSDSHNCSFSTPPFLFTKKQQFHLNTIATNLYSRPKTEISVKSMVWFLFGGLKTTSSSKTLKLIRPKSYSIF
jgi:hypothetical protein